jgi:hypothetical protein
MSAALRRGTFLLACLVVPPAAHSETTNVDVAARLRKDITFLASDQCEGRGVTTKGINLAADFIAREFKEAGLEPAGGDGSFFQPFTMNGAAELQSPNTLVLHGPLGQTITLNLGSDFQPTGVSAAGTIAAPLIFVGYGATARDAAYDDFKNIDVAGKIVVMLRKTPRADNTYVPFDGSSSAYHAALTTKLTNAELHKAVGAILVNDRGMAGASDQLMSFDYASYGPGSKLPVVHLRRSVFDSILQSSLGQGLSEIEQAIDRELTPQSAGLVGWSASLTVTVRRPTIIAKNVVGVARGAGSLAKQVIVVGAHYDHWGYGGFGSLGRNEAEKKAIHHGADDNASGTTALIELARRFAQPQRSDRRTLLFIAFSGEEWGLLGSEYYCKQPLFPLADTVAMINMDMVGRLRPDKETGKNKLIVYGTGTASSFDKLIESLNAKFGFKLQKVPTGLGPSDQQSFYVKNVPVFFFFTGDHLDYHRPTDTVEKINIDGMVEITELVATLVERLQIAAERPKFVKVKGETSRSPRMQGPRLGIRPTYGDDKEGVLLSGVTEGTPAARAGLREGDRIVEMAGKPVKNLEAYMAVMAGQKKGDGLELAIIRDGKRVTIKVVLE